MCSNVYDDVTNFDVCGFTENIEIIISWDKIIIFCTNKKTFIINHRQQSGKNSFFSGTWQSHRQCWVTVKGPAPLTSCYHCFCNLLDPKVTKSLVTRLGPKAHLRTQWGMNQDPFNSDSIALTHWATLPKSIELEFGKKIWTQFAWDESSFSFAETVSGKRWNDIRDRLKQNCEFKWQTFASCKTDTVHECLGIEVFIYLFMIWIQCSSRA